MQHGLTVKQNFWRPTPKKKALLLLVAATWRVLSDLNISDQLLSANFEQRCEISTWIKWLSTTGIVCDLSNRKFTAMSSAFASGFAVIKTKALRWASGITYRDHTRNGDIIDFELHRSWSKLWERRIRWYSQTTSQPTTCSKTIFSYASVMWLLKLKQKQKKRELPVPRAWHPAQIVSLH